MSTITIYYDNPTIEFNTGTNPTFDCSGGDTRSTPDLVYKGVIYSLRSISLDKDNNTLYIKHVCSFDRHITREFILKINITDNTHFSSESTLNDFLTGSRSTINIQSLIDNAIQNPDHNVVKLGKRKTDVPVFVCDIGSLCIRKEIRQVINLKFSTFDDKDFIPANTELENKEIRISFSSTPKKTIRNCKRTNPDGSESGAQKMKKDYFLKHKSNSIVGNTAMYIIMTFVLIAAVLIAHIYTKDPFSDFWGFPIPQTSGMMGGGSKASSIPESKMSGGGSCYIPTEISVNFPKPDLVAFGKMAAFLFFIQTIIYGAIKNNTDWIGVSIASLVLLGLVSTFYRIVKNVGVDDGIHFSNMFLFSDQTPPAKIPALLMYLTFYTSFIRLASKQYKKDEIIAFVVNFLLFAFWGVALVLMEVKNMTSPVFWLPAIVMTGLSIWYMVIIFEPPKKEEEPNNAPTDTGASNANTLGSGGGLGVRPPFA